MNYRNRDLLNLAYELPCTGKITADCGNSMSEPAHANEAIWGKGKSLKAHDFAFAAMCRSCHAELDQGKTLSREARQFVWLRGHVDTMRLLWERGLLLVGDFRDIMDSKPQETRVVPEPTAKPYRKAKRGPQTQRSTKTLPRRGL